MYGKRNKHSFGLTTSEGIFIQQGSDIHCLQVFRHAEKAKTYVKSSDGFNTYRVIHTLEFN
jgi:hypothetical protein